MYHKFKFLCVHSLNLTKNNLTKKLGTYIIYDMCIYHKFLCVLFNKNKLNQKIGWQGSNLPAQNALFAH